MISVLIADDHGLVRKGVELMTRTALGAACKISFAHNGSEVIAQINEGLIDMLITDVNMPGTNALDMITQALALVPRLKILVISVNPENVFGPRFLQAGVLGYISKEAPDDETVEAIKRVSMGKRFITDTLSKQFAEAYISNSPNNPFDSLSNREFEVTMLLLKGYGAIEIANALSINNSTASSYKFRVFEKLGVKNLLELSRLAQQFNISGN